MTAESQIVSRGHQTSFPAEGNFIHHLYSLAT